MKKILIPTGLIAGSILALSVFASTASAATLDTNLKTNTGIRTNTGSRAEIRASSTARVDSDKAVARANEEIARRISSLTALSTKIQGLKHVSVNEKASVTAEVQTQISTLSNLKTKIDADTDSAVLKTDIQSITESYRIYLLVIPQGHLLAAADRINTIADDMTAISTKLQARITVAQNAGKDVSALVSAESDIHAKSADAKVQAAAAINAVASLTPDNGDAAKKDSNKVALVAARANIKTGTDDLKTARKDIDTIVKGLKGFNLKTKVTASSTTSF